MLKRLSLAQKLLLSYAMLLGSVLVFALAFLLPDQLNELQRNLERQLSDAALVMSTNPGVIKACREQSMDEIILSRMDEIANSMAASGDLMVADRDGVRLYHSNHGLIGKRCTDDKAKRLLQGSEPFISRVIGPDIPQLQAFHGVRDDDGAMLGFVMVSETLSSIEVVRRSLTQRMLGVCAAAFCFGMLLAYGMSRNIRKTLLGNEPQTFVRMYLQRDDILARLAEGIMAVDEQGEIVFKNAAATKMVPEDAIGEGHPLAPAVRSCIETGEVREGMLVGLDDRSLVVDSMAVVREGLFRTAMLILRDRTEMVRLTEQMMGTNYIVDALRAKTHEFLNRLHVIYGLLQLGETEQAMSLIGDVSEEVASSSQMVVRQIEDRAVAALVLGKMSRASELGIALALRADSTLPATGAPLSSHDIVTVVGNLVENAFEAMSCVEGTREVELAIVCRGGSLEISVDDTGRGMSPEQVAALSHGRYSTKGETHGYGMELVREIARRSGGCVQIESEQGIGSSISLVIGGPKDGVETND